MQKVRVRCLGIAQASVTSNTGDTTLHAPGADSALSRSVSKTQYSRRSSSSKLSRRPLLVQPLPHSIAPWHTLPYCRREVTSLPLCSAMLPSDAFTSRAISHRKLHGLQSSLRYSPINFELYQALPLLHACIAMGMLIDQRQAFAHLPQYLHHRHRV